MYALDDAIELEQMDDGQFILTSSKLYWNYTSAFGGWICAGIVNGVEQSAGYRGELFSLNINFVSAVSADQIFLDVENVSAKRTMDFWRVTGRDAPAGEKVLFTADLITGQRRENKLVYNAPKPDFKSLEDSIEFRHSAMTPAWLKAYEQYIARGVPFSKNNDAQTVTYLKERDGRPLDAKGIAAIMDTPLPRTFLLQKEPTAPASLSLATHIMASKEEISKVGNAPLHVVADCAAVSHSLYNQETRLFREDGLLLAASYQMALAI